MFFCLSFKAKQEICLCFNILFTNFELFMYQIKNNWHTSTNNKHFALFLHNSTLFFGHTVYQEEWVMRNLASSPDEFSQIFLDKFSLFHKDSTAIATANIEKRLIKKIKLPNINLINIGLIFTEDNCSLWQLNFKWGHRVPLKVDQWERLSPCADQ